MACSLIAAAAWIQAATSLGFPVSTTHSIIGAVLGFGLTAGGAAHVNWRVLGGIGLSWIVAPALGGLVAYLLFRWLQRAVFEDEHSARIAARLAPLVTFGIVTLLVFVLVTEVRPPLALAWPLERALPVAAGIGLVCAAIVYLRAWAMAQSPDPETTERLFALLQIVTACFVAFAHGSNDVANAVAPVAVAFSALGGEPVSSTVTSTVIPTNVLMIGACGIVLGLSTYGFRVMATIGKEITELTPSRGFAAEFAAALIIIGASKLALPVSTTNVLVGAVVGVGLNRSLGAINLRVLQGIVASWIISVPISALTAAGLTLILKLLL
jgi:PiT family inorganic phosphate transporter